MARPGRTAHHRQRPVAQTFQRIKIRPAPPPDENMRNAGIGLGKKQLVVTDDAIRIHDGIQLPGAASIHQTGRFIRHQNQSPVESLIQQPRKIHGKTL